MRKLLLLFFIPIALYSCKKTEFDAAKQAATDKAIILQYLRDSSLVADSSSTGLYYVISDTGTVNHPASTSFVTMYYKGYLTNGTIFDQTAGTTYKSFANRMIAGMTEGIQLIGKGGKIKLLIPSALGYGNADAGSIPANSVLIFDIELVNFQ